MRLKGKVQQLIKLFTEIALKFNIINIHINSILLHRAKFALTVTTGVLIEVLNSSKMYALK